MQEKRSDAELNTLVTQMSGFKPVEMKGDSDPEEDSD